MLYNYSIGRLKTGNILDIESDDIVYSALADTYFVCLELEPGTYIHQVQLLQSVHFVLFFDFLFGQFPTLCRSSYSVSLVFMFVGKVISSFNVEMQSENTN